MYFMHIFREFMSKMTRYFTRTKVNEVKFLIKLKIQIKTLLIINLRKPLAPSSLV